MRHYRAYAACAAAAVLGYGVVFHRTLPDALDPWSARIGVATACGALALWPTRTATRAFTIALYAVLALITAWVLSLLQWNAFMGEYEVGLLMIVALVGAVVRSSRALAAYGVLTLAGVLAIAATVGAPRTNPLLFASHLATVLVVCVVIARGRRRAAWGLAASEARYRLLFDASPRPLWVHDVASRVIIAVNDAAIRQYGYSRDEFLGRSIDSLSAEDPGLPGAEPHAVARDAAVLEVDVDGIYRQRTKAGAVIDVEITSHALDWEGRAAWLVLATDISAQRRLESELTRQARHDPLTGLANRVLFTDRVEAALARAARAGGAAAGAVVAVLFFDLDDFKTVNDSLGHGAGDALLTGVARRLLNATRGCDTVARLGGDEFAVLLDGVHAAVEATLVAERVLAALTHPVPLDTGAVLASASIGIATSTHAETVEALLRNADMAMYQAKSGSKGRFALFQPALYDALRERVALEHDLRQAVEANALRIVYQPIVDLATERVLGIEALLRWRHAERGDVSPAAFIPVAEASGLILPLGGWVLREACARGALLHQRGASDLYVAVNVSGRQLMDPRFVGEVTAALAASELPASALLLELTENVLMQDTEENVARLHALRALGVRIAIDDFGTGYSSLAYLHRFPIDVLKIDKRFVDRVTAGGNDAALARTVIALGEALGVRTVAEGVETADQQAELLTLGCRVGQGYLFARPMEAHALDDRVGTSVGHPLLVAVG